MISYQKTPIEEIHWQFLERAGVRLLVKREDLNHPVISGNKWWKLKYILEEVKRTGKDTVLTLGGAYSNHIRATACAAYELGLRSLGIIRGEETLPLNRSLQSAVDHGMKLHYVSRGSYQTRETPEFLNRLKTQFGDFYFIPEGGTNDLAVKGCAEMAEIVLGQTDFDFVFLPVGTGGTLAGLVAGLRGRKKVVGVSVLKGGDFLDGVVENLVQEYCGREFSNWRILQEYHFGGYAKTNERLSAFIEEQRENGIPADFVYTAKALYAIADQARKGNFSRGTTLLLLQTGGIQFS